MPIVIKTHRVPEFSEKLIGTVRLTSEAETIVRQLQRESGLSMRAIVSQIIIAADTDGIEIREV